MGAVHRAHPPQPTEHVGDVRAEDAAVVVALVDHDVLQGAEEARPPVVGRQERAVQHVGVGQDVLPEVARPVALLARAVAVMGGQAYVEAQGRQPGELVVGQRLGRREVEHRRAALAADAAGRADRRQRGQLVGQRLPRGRAGRHDHVVARVRRVGGHDLVAPRPGHALRGEGAADVVGHPGRPVLVHRLPGGEDLEVPEAVLAPRHTRQSTDQHVDRGQCAGAGRTHGRSLAKGSDGARPPEVLGSPAQRVGLVV